MTDENRQRTRKEPNNAQAQVWDMLEQREVLEEQEGANDGHSLD